MITERFAPSPTGLLHLGHAYSALIGYNAAKQNSGRFLLRIEDIDTFRSKPEFTQAIKDDLNWLGINWDMNPIIQSTRFEHYSKALSRLEKLGLTYACQCTRRDIEAAVTAPQEGSQQQIIYPGTCRDKSVENKNSSIRLNMKQAVRKLPDSILEYEEIGYDTPLKRKIKCSELIDTVGDIVLARRDIGTSYNIAVIVDDEEQNVTHVTRGRDLEDITFTQVLLQKLLGYSTPIYRHHDLIRDQHEKRLAKRDDSRAIAQYRKDGLTPSDIKRMLGFA